MNDDNGMQIQTLAAMLTMMSRARDAVMNASMYDTGGVKHVATNDVLETLERRSYTGEPGEMCPITFEELTPESIVTTLPCGHTFSADAIHKWLSTEKSECPVCRAALASREVSTVNNVQQTDIASAYGSTPIRNILAVHPFGPDNTHRLVSVICEDDDVADVRFALNSVFTHFSTSYD